MKTQTKKGHVALSILAGLFAVCFASITFATTNATGTTTQTSNTAYNPKEVINVGNTGRFVQTVKEGDLDVQFRYEKNELTYIRFKNVGTKPMQLNILTSRYILGPGDSVVINPPKLKYITFTNQVYIDDLDTIASNVLTERFGEIHQYQLPPNTDTKAQ